MSVSWSKDHGGQSGAAIGASLTSQSDRTTSGDESSLRRLSRARTGLKVRIPTRKQVQDFTDSVSSTAPGRNKAVMAACKQMKCEACMTGNRRLPFNWSPYYVVGILVQSMQSSVSLNEIVCQWLARGCSAQGISTTIGPAISPPIRLSFCVSV